MSLSFFTPPARPADEAERQRAVDLSGVLSMIDDPALDDLVRRAAALFDAPMAALSIIDRHRQVFVARHGLEASATSRAASFCGHAILTPDRALLVPDAAEDGRFAGNPLVLGAPGLRFYVGAPLLTVTGHALGALCALDGEPRPDTDPAAVARLADLSRDVTDLLQIRALRSAA